MFFNDRVHSRIEVHSYVDTQVYFEKPWRTFLLKSKAKDCQLNQCLLHSGPRIGLCMATDIAVET